MGGGNRSYITTSNLLLHETNLSPMHSHPLALAGSHLSCLRRPFFFILKHSKTFPPPWVRHIICQSRTARPAVPASGLRDNRRVTAPTRYTTYYLGERAYESTRQDAKFNIAFTQIFPADSPPKLTLHSRHNNNRFADSLRCQREGGPELNCRFEPSRVI
ncbi:hypothetical protein LZ30DRAFT_42192 [Colletotrichum cereale]|nr:hypothetical protein LZ30DRAFT_42192 [Colletotrichum cereale]